MTKLYKYRNFEDQYVENIIKNSSLFFSPIEYFNDPFDCKLSFKQSYTKQGIKKYFLDFKERNPNQLFKLKNILRQYGKNKDFVKYSNDAVKKIVSDTGVLSLSSNYSSILMWSHYSSSHTGLVFGFEPIDVEKESSCFYHPMKIDYDTNYEELSFTKNHREETPKLLLTKYTDWSYEEEYRCIELNFKGEKKFNNKELTTIIFGALTTKTNIQKIINLCNEYDFKHVKFKKAQLNHGQFSLSFKDIS